MILRSRHTYPVEIGLNLRSHWEPPHGSTSGVKHKQCPKQWAWWRLLKLYPCNLDVAAPSSGHRLWVYTRWGAIYLDVYIDRRLAVDTRNALPQRDRRGRFCRSGVR